MIDWLLGVWALVWRLAAALLFLWLMSGGLALILHEVAP